jgi:hypothetical protein
MSFAFYQPPQGRRRGVQRRRHGLGPVQKMSTFFDVLIFLILPEKVTTSKIDLLHQFGLSTF